MEGNGGPGGSRKNGLLARLMDFTDSEYTLGANPTASGPFGLPWAGGATLDKILRYAGLHLRNVNQRSNCENSRKRLGKRDTSGLTEVSPPLRARDRCGKAPTEGRPTNRGIGMLPLCDTGALAFL